MFVVGDSMAKKEWPNCQIKVCMPSESKCFLVRTSAFLVYWLDGGGRAAESYGLEYYLTLNYSNILLLKASFINPFWPYFPVPHKWFYYARARVKKSADANQRKRGAVFRTCSPGFNVFTCDVLGFFRDL